MDDRLMDCYDCQYYVFDIFTGQSYCKHRNYQISDTVCDRCRKRKSNKSEGAKNV